MPWASMDSCAKEFRLIRSAWYWIRPLIFQEPDLFSLIARLLLLHNQNLSISVSTSNRVGSFYTRAKHVCDYRRLNGETSVSLRSQKCNATPSAIVLNSIRPCPAASIFAREMVPDESNGRLCWRLICQDKCRPARENLANFKRSRLLQ